MTTNPLKRKLRSGQACFGAWMLSTSADMAEILAYAGMDFLLLDHEHGQGTIDRAIGQLRAIKGSDCVGVLRVPLKSVEKIEAGMSGEVLFEDLWVTSNLPLNIGQDKTDSRTFREASKGEES